MRQPLISIIIPVYNVEKYLTECLESVINQTYRNIEIICINDGSTDKSLSILENYKKNDSRIIIINKTNGGVSSARNCGIDVCRGDAVIFLDSDDYIHPKFVEVLLNLLDETKCDIAVCGYSNDKNLSDSINNTITFYDINSFQSEFFIKTHVWGRIYTASLIKSTRFPLNINLGEDTVFNLTVICNNLDSKIVYVDKKLYYYRNNDNSLVHTVKHSDIYKTGNYYLENIDKLNNDKATNIYLIEAFKSFLAYRYLKMFDKDRAEVNEFCHNKMKILLRKMKNNTNINIKVYMIYRIFAKFPRVYRKYRKITDPTMIKWEKERTLHNK